MVPIQLNSFTAQYFLPSVFNAPSRGSLFRIGPISIIQTCVITWKFSWTFFKFFWRIQLLWFALGWGAVILGLFSVINAGNAVQKPLIKKVLSPRRLELRTLCVWGARDNHYTMVKFLNFSHLSSLGWFCNMYVVDVNAVSSKVCPQQRRSLLSTRALITGQVLWKVHVLLRGCECFAFFWLFSVVLRLQLSLLEFAC